MKNEIIGIDVSKKTIDVFLYHRKVHKQFANNDHGFIVLMNWLFRTYDLPATDLSFLFEHTGLYSLPLSTFLHQQNIEFYVVSGLMIKRSLGLARGKNDKVDAQNLARFAYLHKEELHPYQMPSEEILKLKELYSFRRKLVKQRSGYKAQLSELKQVLAGFASELMVRRINELIKTFNQEIKLVEKEMYSIIKAAPALKLTYSNITTIKGVGPIVAIAMLAFTNNFQSFNNWRKFACYAGIAPFPHQSGTSYKGRTKVSSLGNREVKSLLGQSASSAIQHSQEMKLYYQRRLQQGKNKLSTLNIIKNKILSRIFAVAHRQTPYVDTFKFAA